MDYAELSCRSNFSFLEGASHPEELVERALVLGLRGLALTDRDGVYGVVRAYQRLREVRRLGSVAGQEVDLERFRLIAGARLTVAGWPPLIALARDREGYANLCALLTRGRRRAAKGQSRIEPDELEPRTKGLIAILPDPRPREPSPEGPGAAREIVARARDLFGEELSLGLARHLLPGQEARLAELIRLGRELDVALVAVGEVLYHDPSRQPLQDVLTCIRAGCTVREAGLRLRPNGERCLHGPDEMARRFADLPAAVRRSAELAERCTFSLGELRYRYPAEVLPEGEADAMSYLTRLVREGARWRYPEGVPGSVRARLDHELRLIAQLDFPHYFLTVYDLVRFARSREILCQGRGSAANSAVCYVLGITSVDPAHSDLLFERFISPERGEPPDIDLDCEHERREEMIQYLYDRYGRDRAALACTVISYRSRSALREVGKALSYPEATVDELAQGVLHSRGDGVTPALFAEAGLDPRDPGVRLYGALARQLTGFPRHLSIHPGGFVLSDEPLDRIVPVENAAMADRTVIQWDKDDLDALNLLKVDVLGLGMLTCLRKTFELVRRHEGEALTLATVPPDDPETYDMICRADTVGVFQIESRAQMTMLPRLRPRCFYDLVVEVAIVRPGPIQGDMVHPYLRRRNGEEPVEYPHPALKEILGRTYGVPLFQEQVMRLAVAVAGFTPGEADELRRSMGSWRRTGRMSELAAKLWRGMREQGLDEAFAKRILEQIKGFAEYGFPESHAASFALLVYASAYLKCHHRVPFICGLLNSLPMGFYPPRLLVADVQRHGEAVRPPDVQRSDWDCTLEPYAGGRGERRLALRLGLRLVKGLPEAAGQAIAEVRRRRGPFIDLPDLQRRSGANRGALERLAAAGALEGLIADRREALWAVRGLAPSPEDLLGDVEPTDQGEAVLPPASLCEEVVADFRALGLSLRSHPLALLRPQFEDRGVICARDLPDRPDKQRVTVAGLVLTRQRPRTASGTVFVSLEDETGIANVVIWPARFEQFHRVASRSALLWVTGELQRTGIVTHVIASHIGELELEQPPLRVQARNFR